MNLIRKLAVVIVLLSPMAANADLIEVTGAGENNGYWEITLVEGSFDSLESLLVSQVWWGENIVDFGLATIFADALGGVSGVDNFLLGLGPLFAYFANTTDLYFSSYGDGTSFGPGAGPIVSHDQLSVRVFATATRVPEPGTLALFGIGLLGMGLARRRKV
jgi:hypothetical protein